MVYCWNTYYHMGKQIMRQTVCFALYWILIFPLDMRMDPYILRVRTGIDVYRYVADNIKY